MRARTGSSWTSADLPVPAFTGTTLVEPDLRLLREFIDWQFFFTAWELKGKYPGILEQPAARELFDDGQRLLDEIIEGGLLQARGVYGFWPAHADGDDIVIDGDAGLRFPMLRQQEHRADRPNRCLADYVAPAGDYLGAFAVAVHGGAELAARYEAARDDYNAISVKALADRLAEAFAEFAHLEARRAWFEPDAEPVLADLHAERFRGIRPAFGYPASPDHSLKQDLVRLLDAGPGLRGPDRLVRDDPRGERQRPDLRAPAGALLQRRPDRPGPGDGLRGAQGRGARRDRVLAATESRLRALSPISRAAPSTG